YKDIEWIVASASSLPIEDESLDFIICMFAKIIPEEKMRTLKKGGKLIVVSTGENHLLQLKEVVYEEVRKEFYSPVEDLKIFSHINTVNVKYEIDILEKESIENLFNMTPYRWRSPQIGVEKLFSLNNLTTTVEVNIDIFEKK
ncbi:MAG: putative RNA methyltransferase, partial [Cetobacterium sp.]